MASFRLGSSKLHENVQIGKHSHQSKAVAIELSTSLFGLRSLGHLSALLEAATKR
jgi:hypothetical protein